VNKTERAAQLADVTGLGGLLRRLRPGAPTVVLAYHRIGDGSGSPYDRAGWDASADALDAQLSVLARDYEVVSPQTMTQPAKRPRVLITFDDGYRDNHDVALALLRRHGLSATFFLTTGFLDHQRVSWWDELAWMAHTSPRTELVLEGESFALMPSEVEHSIARLLARYKTLAGEETEAYVEAVGAAAATGRHPQPAHDTWMTWDMARAMRDAGMTIGGHSAAHPILSRLSAAEQRADIAHCAQRLEAELGQPMRWFSYPVGLRDSFNSDSRAALVHAGVEAAFSLYGITDGGADRYDIQRCSIGGAQAARFRMMLNAPRLFARA